MTKKVQTRKRHSEEFKDEVLRLASNLGATKAAKQLETVIKTV